MAQRVEHNPLDAAFAALLTNGLDGAGEALRILVNEASKIERAQFLNARSHERTTERIDYAHGLTPKTVMTRVGELTFEVPQGRWYGPHGDRHAAALACTAGCGVVSRASSSSCAASTPPPGPRGGGSCPASSGSPVCSICSRPRMPIPPASISASRSRCVFARS